MIARLRSSTSVRLGFCTSLSNSLSRPTQGRHRMTKKAAEKDKQTTAKPKGNSDLVSSPAGSEVRSRGSKPMKLTDDPRFTQAVQNYEAGLKALQAHKYDRAKACFEKVVGGPSPELADRALVHL